MVLFAIIGVISFVIIKVLNKKASGTAVKRKKESRPLFNYLILIIRGGLYPGALYITIVNSFKTQAQSSQSFFTLPSSLKLENFQSVLSDPYLSVP